VPQSDPDAIARELRAVRQRHGVTKRKVVEKCPLALSLPVIGAMVSGADSNTNRAFAFCGLVHEILRSNQEDRGYRAVANALNLDLTKTWSGEITRPPGLRSSFLGVRRTRFAESEGTTCGTDGKPVSDWENAAFRLVADELLSYSQAPFRFDGGPIDPAASISHNEHQEQEVSENDRSSGVAALLVAIVAVLVAIAIGTGVINDDWRTDTGGDDPETPTASQRQRSTQNLRVSLTTTTQSTSRSKVVSK